jgi:hypothetical protein
MLTDVVLEPTLATCTQAVPLFSKIKYPVAPADAVQDTWATVLDVAVTCAVGAATVTAAAWVAAVAVTGADVAVDDPTVL